MLRIENVHNWLIEQLLTNGIVDDATLRTLQEEDVSRGLLFLDYLVSQGLVNLIVEGQRVEYRVSDRERLVQLKKPMPSSNMSIGPQSSVTLVYSTPSSLLADVQGLLDRHSSLQILSLEQAFNQIMRGAKKELSIVTPFIEWDGLGYFLESFKSAAQRNVKIRLITRGVLTPERNSDYSYLEKVKTLLKMYQTYDGLVSNPEGRFEVRDYNNRLQSSFNASIHYEGVHQKMLIADNQIAYVGSGEMRAASFISNGECGSIHTGDMATFWYDFFNVFWKKSQSITKHQLQEMLSIPG